MTTSARNDRMALNGMGNIVAGEGPFQQTLKLQGDLIRSIGLCFNDLQEL
jgi:hypothetical protein